MILPFTETYADTIELRFGSPILDLIVLPCYSIFLLKNEGVCQRMGKISGMVILKGLLRLIGPRVDTCTVIYILVMGDGYANKV